MIENKIEINNDTCGRSFAKYTNQKVVQIKRVDEKRKSINFDANRQAMQNLTPNGYMLYMNLILWPHDTAWALSSKEVYQRTTLKRRTYEAAIEDLISHGYLVPHDIRSPSGNFKADDNAYYLLEDNTMAY